MFVAGTHLLLLGDYGRSQATYDCSIGLEPFDCHIIFINNGFIDIMDRLST